VFAGQFRSGMPKNFKNWASAAPRKKERERVCVCREIKRVRESFLESVREEVESE